MSFVRQSLIPLVVLATLLLCPASPLVQAETIDRCQRRVVHAEHELHEAIRRHGLVRATHPKESL